MPHTYEARQNVHVVEHNGRFPRTETHIHADNIRVKFSGEEIVDETVVIFYQGLTLFAETSSLLADTCRNRIRSVTTLIQRV